MVLTGEPRPEFETLEAPISTMKINLAFMNDLDIVAVRIEHPCRIIARIVFGPSLRCFLALASGVHSRFVECIYLSMVFRYKSNMHRLGIGLSFFEPEKSSFAVTKTLQIGVSVFSPLAQMSRKSAESLISVVTLRNNSSITFCAFDDTGAKEFPILRPSV